MRRSLAIAAAAVGVAGCGTTTTITQTNTVELPAKTVTVQAATHTVASVRRVTVTVTETRTGAKAATPVPSPTSAHRQIIRGNGDENVGTIQVPVQSTLQWSSPGAGLFGVSNSFDDPGTISIYDIGAGSAAGHTVVDAGTYHDVSVTADAAWTITITPGNSTQG